MKKLIAILALALIFIIIYMLELNFFGWFTIAGVKPNVLVIFILFIGLYAGKQMGTTFGILIRVYYRYLRKFADWTFRHSAWNNMFF